jgi:hypothetical protein
MTDSILKLSFSHAKNLWSGIDIFNFSNSRIFKLFCGQGWIRTTELRREQIYSLLSLAT